MPYIIATSFVLAICSLFFYQPFLVVRLVARFFSQVLWFSSTTRRLIALTFDDGPDPQYTPQVLRTLASPRVRATFFLIGANALRHPDLVNEIHAGGHLIANHLFVDRNALFLSAAEVEDSLLKTEEILGLQGNSKWVRPPGAVFRPSFLAVARKHDYRVVLGSAYTSDTRRPPARYISWAMNRMTRPGAVLVLHDSGGDRSRTVAALPEIIDHAHAQGYTFVTLDELLAFERSSNPLAKQAPTASQDGSWSSPR